MKQEITARQKEILGFIAEFGQENGYPPSLRDIASHFGISSTNGVAGHLEALVTKNFLSKESNSSRTLTITEKGWSVLGLEGQTAEKEDENPFMSSRIAGNTSSVQQSGWFRYDCYSHRDYRTVGEIPP